MTFGDYDSPPGLNENQARRLSVTCKYIDKVIGEIQEILNSAASKAAFPQYIQDITPIQRRTIEVTSTHLRFCASYSYSTWCVFACTRPRPQRSAAWRMSFWLSASPNFRPLANSHSRAGDLLALLERCWRKDMVDVLPLVLVNPFMNEAQVLRVLARASTPKQVIVAVAEHSKWSVRYNVRLALLRNAQTPIAAALQFLPHLLLPDLRELLRAGGVATHLREHLKRELARRSGGSSLRGPH